MAQKKAHEVENFLKTKSLSYGIVLIYGQDKGLISEYAAVFSKNCNVNLQDPFAYVKMDADLIDKNAGALIDEAQTIALFGGKRLIRIYYNGTGAKSGMTDAVKFLLQKTLQDCFIVIEAGDLKKTALLRKIIEDSAHGLALPCYIDERESLGKLIDAVTKEFGCSIEDDARAVLQNNLGGNRLISRSELEKLCLYKQNSGTITTDDIKNISSDVAALAADDITDSIICGDLKKFDIFFSRHNIAGTPIFLVLFAVIRQFQQLQIFCHSIEYEHKDKATVLAAARPPIFFKRRKTLETALTLWTAAKISAALQRLQKTLLETRQYSELSVNIARQNLLALTLEARRKK